jgi:formylglycine-generating enzyme required for sulfatase activity
MVHNKREGTMRAVVAMIVFVLTATGAIAPAQAAESFRDCGDCPLIVAVPAGSFMMGSTSKEADREGVDPELVSDERPVHSVSVNRFSLGVAEVTRDQFDAFVRATGHQAGGPCRVYDPAQGKGIESGVNDWRDPGFPQGGDHPVVCVNWNDAKAYAQWLSQETGKAYRLASEAEWEYAARAGTAASRYWGDSRSDPACLNANVSDRTIAAALNLATSDDSIFQCADGYVYTAPVGRFQANAFGLHDMIGNVFEWTEDCYHDSYIGAPTNGSAWVAGDCSFRVARGGSWISQRGFVRSAIRVRVSSSVRGDSLGFRVARTN